MLEFLHSICHRHRALLSRSAPYAVLAFLSCRLTLTEEGMALRGLSIGTEFIPWQEIAYLSYSDWWKAYRVDTRDGQVHWVPIELTGVERLYEYLDRHVGRAAEEEVPAGVA